MIGSKDLDPKYKSIEIPSQNLFYNTLPNVYNIFL